MKPNELSERLSAVRDAKQAMPPSSVSGQGQMIQRLPNSGLLEQP
ncbi:hypothetical protein [Microvirga sp. TS319]